jgi:hypothetical protein
MGRRDIGPMADTDVGRTVYKYRLDLAGVSVGATIGLREARKWRGRYACGVIVKRAAIRAEGEALRRGGICRCGYHVGELRELLR